MIGIGIAWFFFDRLFAHERLLKIGIGIIALLFVVYQLSRELILKRIEGVRFSNWAGVMLTTTAGFTSTIAHVGGPPFQIYLIPQKLPRDRFVGTNAWFFWAVNIIKLIPFWFLGLLTLGNLSTTLVLIPVIPIGIFLGVWLNRKVQQDVFNWIIYGLMTITGIQLVLGQSLISMLLAS